VGVVASAAAAAWWFFTPRALGLDRPRVVLVAVGATADGRHLQVSDVLTPGRTLRTGEFAGMCFSVHASRVCLGSSSEARLASADAHVATIEATHGVIVVSARGDDVVRVTTPDGAAVVRGATASVELTATDSVVRSLDGSLDVEPNGRPPGAIASPAAVGLRDGASRPPTPNLAREELGVATVALRWQGSAGAVVVLGGPYGRAKVDGTDIGRLPASVLLDEGEHTLVVSNGVRETVHETVRLRGGERVARGG
jgi:hypothetical protein